MALVRAPRGSVRTYVRPAQVFPHHLRGRLTPFPPPPAPPPRRLNRPVREQGSRRGIGIARTALPEGSRGPNSSAPRPALLHNPAKDCRQALLMAGRRRRALQPRAPVHAATAGRSRVTRVSARGRSVQRVETRLSFLLVVGRGGSWGAVEVASGTTPIRPACRHEGLRGPTAKLSFSIDEPGASRCGGSCVPTSARKPWRRGSSMERQALGARRLKRGDACSRLGRACVAAAAAARESPVRSERRSGQRRAAATAADLETFRPDPWRALRAV